MEHHDRAPVASFHTDTPIPPRGAVSLGEGAAHHARVKRLATGDLVRLTSGAGAIALGSIEELRRDELRVQVTELKTVPAPSPIHVRIPVADRDRMLWLAEKAAELGVATWQTVRFRRSASVSPRGEGHAFEEKVRARMIGALEQSGGAWLPRLLPAAMPESISLEANHIPVLLDVEGAPLSSVVSASGGREPVILFGPEGGLEAEERAELIARGWSPARVAETTLRFETAGIAAIAVCRNVT